MKYLLLSAAALGLSAGLSSAEISLSGDARMGIIDDFGPGDVAFTSRARVKFNLSGETDGGLAFGASFRADNASSGACTDSDFDGFCDGTENGADNGTAGEVFISGAFGKLSMGDVDGAAQAAVGNVDGVGLTGLGDLNEAIYLTSALTTADPTVLYEYSGAAFSAYLSMTNQTGTTEVAAIGLKYATDTFSVAAGFEDRADSDTDHLIVGATANLGAVTLKANYGHANTGSGVTSNQTHVSATYAVDALSVTAFYADEEDFGSLGDYESYGLGATYDLGGGASLVGGYSRWETLDTSAVDLGLSFSF